MVPSCYRQIWFVDTEFHQPDGERPAPICLVARERSSGAVVRQWLWGQHSPPSPFSVDSDVLFVAYSAPAELLVYLALGWPLPVRILDLYAEYRWLLSGFKMPGYGQLDALAAFGLTPPLDELTKEDMRSVCRRGGPFAWDEERDILDYCQKDVDGLAALFEVMHPSIDWPRALFRGRYTVAVARMEAHGIPVDVETHQQLQKHRRAIRAELLEEAGATFGIYDEDEFDTSAFSAYLADQGIPWPRTRTGRLSTREETFEEMVTIHPQLRPLYELRSALGQLKDDGGLTIGADGRNRSSLRPFAANSGRNAPSTTRFVFGKSVAFRSLIQPAPGWSLAYVDWCQQEFGIAAVLSGDANMLDAYQSGDPYLEFARQAGAVPATATRHSHEDVREQFKTCMLGVNYSMGEKSLARRIKQPLARARELLETHRRVYRRYWRWIEQVQDEGMLSGRLSAVFGWRLNVGRDANPRSLKNFPMQANGAEMMRLACCLATERGTRVIAPVHDALLIETPSRFVQDAVASTKRAMAEASQIVLSGFTLRTDAEIISCPDRYRDARGAAFWSLLMRILERVRKKEKSPPNPL
jgi:hypothetical protein